MSSMLLQFCCFYLTFIHSDGYGNIALNKNAHMTSAVSPYIASNAVDGNRDQTLSSGTCALTDKNEFLTEAWLQVDLGSIYGLGGIQIYFLNENKNYRFSGFKVYVSLGPTWTPDTPCYVDNGGVESAAGVHTVFQITSCNQAGRYLTIYKSKLETCVQPSDPDQCTILGICEVVIDGCPVGKYGSNCDLVCPENCRYDVCDVNTGDCFACKDGYDYSSNRDCTAPCMFFIFGDGCAFVCANCAKGCSNVNGYCEGGCESGWKGNRCNETCDIGEYGENCASTCGQCRCNLLGRCISDCVSGWTGDRCDVRVKCNVSDLDSVFSERDGPISGEMDINETVTFRCNSGYNRVSGDVQRTCSEYGNWTGKPLVCSLCECECKTYMAINDTEALTTWTKQMKRNLTYNPKDTSKYKRTKISAADERAEAETIGFILGVGLLTGVVVLIVVPDLPKFVRDVRYGHD